MLAFIANLFYYTIYGVIVLLVYLFSGKNVSEKFRKRYFADYFTSDWIVKLNRHWLHEHRLMWLKDFTQLKPNNPNEKLSILEVGVGEGSNFDLYPENSRLTALDYNEYFKEKFMKNIKKYPNIELNRFLIANMEDMNQLEDNSFDAVLVTHVLCSVSDISKGISEIKRVLKRGGKFIFFEHVGYHEKGAFHLFWSVIQKFVNPFWFVVFCGCHLTRKPWIEIEQAGFKTTQINHSYPERVPGFIRAHMWGCAHK